MSYNSTVLYRNNKDSTFDMKYYLDTHMPLVYRIWSPAGLLKWQVVQYKSVEDPEKTPFIVAAILTWKDEASCTAGVALPGTQEIFGDVPKFTNETPVLMTGNVVGESS